MKIGIVKYNAGNVRSVLFALERVGVNAVCTDDKQELASCDKVIFPGVGEAGSAMKYLRAAELDKLLISLKQPVLGICLGMQLLCKHSEESDTTCLGVFDLQVKQFPKKSIKVPQIGWNTIYQLTSPLFKGVNEQEYQYFVHGYYVERGEGAIALTGYGLEYASALNKNNFYAVQFHPEKSAVAGEKILKNFLDL